ncbi:MAG: glycerol-3-phosphate 1-O-acyltransferase PlsY [Candidatus Omnitrophota bacterium]
MLLIILLIIVSYIIGSIPTAYLFVRIIKGIDIRKTGSGNVGATNALRILGKGWGFSVLFLDILKGFLPVFFLGTLISDRISFIQEHNLLIIIGFCAICGHNWTLFLKFKGGKGVATTLGVLLALSFKIQGLKIALALIVLIWVVSFIFFRIISLSSILAALTFPLFILILKLPLSIIIISFLLSVFIILRHKSNLKRLIKGEEPRLSFKR